MSHTDPGQAADEPAFYDCAVCGTTRSAYPGKTRELKRMHPTIDEPCNDCRRWAGENHRHAWYETNERVSCSAYEKRVTEIWENRNKTIADIAIKLGVYEPVDSVQTLSALRDRIMTKLDEMRPPGGVTISKARYDRMLAYEQAYNLSPAPSDRHMYGINSVVRGDGGGQTIAERFHAAEAMLDAGLVDKKGALALLAAPKVKPPVLLVSPDQHRQLTDIIERNEGGVGLASKHKDVTPPGREPEHITVDLSGDWD